MSFLAMPNVERALEEETDDDDDYFRPVASRPPTPYPEGSIFNLDDALRPDPGTEDDFQKANNAFAFSCGQLNKLLNPKSLEAFMALGGMKGLEIGLRTNLERGLDSDETHLIGEVTFEQATLDRPPENKRPFQGLYFATSTKETIKHVDSSRSFADRRQAFTSNKVPQRKPPSVLRITFNIFADPVAIALILVATAGLVMDLHQDLAIAHTPRRNYAWQEFIALLALTIILTCVETWLAIYRTRRAAYPLDRIGGNTTALVLRSGAFHLIPSSQILVGDLVLLKPGEYAVADGILTTNTGFIMDESGATGESDPIHKISGYIAFDLIRSNNNNNNNNIRSSAAPDPFIISGSRVIDGTAMYVVTSVGIHSSTGKILMCINETDLTSETERRLREMFGIPLLAFGLSATLCLFLGLLIKFVVLQSNVTAPGFEKGQWFVDVLALSLATLYTASSTTWETAAAFLWFCTEHVLMKGGAFPQNHGNDLLRSASTILVDMEALLDQERSVIHYVSIGMDIWDLDNPQEGSSGKDGGGQTQGSKSRLLDHVPQIDVSARSLLAGALAFTSGARQVTEDNDMVCRGPSIEPSLLKFAIKEFNSSTRELILLAKVVCHWPFDTTHNRPFWATLVQLPTGQLRLYLKGYPANIIPICSHTEVTAAHSHSLESQEKRDELLHTLSETSCRPIIPVSLAYRDLENLHITTDPYDINLFQLLNDFVYIGTLGVRVSVREGIRESLQSFQQAGIFIRLLSPTTEGSTLMFSKLCGCFIPGGVVMKSTDFKRLTPNARKRLLPKLYALAEDGSTNSSGGLQVLASLKDMKEIVVMVTRQPGPRNFRRRGVQGDEPFIVFIGPTVGTGNSRFDMSTHAESFGTLATAIEWARFSWDAGRQLACFAAIITATGMLLICVSAFNHQDALSGLHPVHIMWFQLLFLTCASMAFVTESPGPALLRRKPDMASDSLFTVSMWKITVGQTVFQTIVLCVLVFRSSSILGYSSGEAQMVGGLLFNVFAWMQVFTLCGLRLIVGLQGEIAWDYRSFAIPTIIVVAQVLSLVFGAPALGLGKLGAREWAISLVAGLLSFAVILVLHQTTDDLVGRHFQTLLSRFPKPKRKDVEQGEEVVDGHNYSASPGLPSKTVFRDEFGRPRLKELIRRPLEKRESVYMY